MDNYYDYLSLLLEKDKIPDPQQVVKVSICYVENQFLSIPFGPILSKRFYRTYYIKISLYCGEITVRKIGYGTLAAWHEKVDSINSEIYQMKIKRGYLKQHNWILMKPDD